jgi:hypothetical protein
MCGGSAAAGVFCVVWNIAAFIKSILRRFVSFMYEWVLKCYTWSAEKSTRHLHTSRNGAVKVYRHHPVSIAIVGSWVGGCGEMYTESGEVECETAMYRLCTQVRGLVTWRG